MNYPDWICLPCGNRHGVRKSKVAAWHRDRCDVCGTWDFVTEPRDFGHLRDTWKEARRETETKKPATRD